MKKEVKIFLGGGVVLLEGDATTVGYRPSVVDPAISKLNSRQDSEYFYIVKTFSDLIHEYTPEGQQKHYHHFVEKEADIAIFIFDGNIGDRTKEEVERACNSNGKHSRPTIFFYGTNLNESDEIVSYLNSKNQYFQHFNNKEQLLHLIQVDLGMWREKSLLERLKYRRNLRKIEQQTKPTPSEIHSKEEERPIPKYKTYICPTICIFSFLCIFLAMWLNGAIPSYIYLVLAFVWFVLFSGTIFNKRVLGVQKLWKGVLYLGLAMLFCLIAFSVSMSVEENNNEQPISQTAEVVEEEETLIEEVPSKEWQFSINGVSFEMIYVEGGTFTMGATIEQGKSAFSDEKPAHDVLVEDFYIGKYEVTQELWKAVMKTTIEQQRDASVLRQYENLCQSQKDFDYCYSNLYGNGDKYPMYFVFWNECQEFVNHLNSLLSHQLGKWHFALPTEAQWEYAARGGDKSMGYKYAGGNNIDDVAWYEDNSESTIHPVGMKKPNELGLYDMSGNMWEWCQDEYGHWYQDEHGNWYSHTIFDGEHVYRGGSFMFDKRRCRVSNRGDISLSIKDCYVGFRVALVL